MAVQKKHLDQADRLRDADHAYAERIRNRRELTDAAKQGLIARHHAATQDKMGELQAAAQSETAADRSRLHKSAFGFSDLLGDPNTLVVSTRDAQDRAEKLESASAAAALLQRAELAGDEPLARAVAAHAFTQFSQQGAAGLFSGNGTEWAEVVDTYTARRPGKDVAVKELYDLNGSGRTPREMFAFVTPPPPELNGLREAQIQALVSGVDGLTAA